MNSETLLTSIPPGLRTPLLDALNEVCRNYAERRWEPSELNGGKLFEVVYAIIEGALSGTFALTPKKPRNMVEACRALERVSANPVRVGDRSLRILIPRVLTSLYEVRNNRGVGHVGGDVDPNFLDATAVHASCRWVVAELIRIFHNVPTATAQSAVDLLIDRKLPVVWEFEGIKRVLPKLPILSQCLLLSYSQAGWVSASNLLAWTEYSNKSRFRNTVLKRLHQGRLIEYDTEGDRVTLTSAGTHKVESEILPNLNEPFK